MELPIIIRIGGNICRGLLVLTFVPNCCCCYFKSCAKLLLYTAAAAYHQIMRTIDHISIDNEQRRRPMVKSCSILVLHLLLHLLLHVLSASECVAVVKVFHLSG